MSDGRALANNLDLGLQFHTSFGQGFLFDQINEGENLGSGSPPIVDDEIAMHIGNPGIAEAGVLQSQLIHQRAGWTGLGIFEYTARTGGDRLAMAALLFAGLHASGDLPGVLGMSEKHRRNHDGFFKFRHTPVAGRDFTDWPVKHLPFRSDDLD